MSDIWICPLPCNTASTHAGRCPYCEQPRVLVVDTPPDVGWLKVFEIACFIEVLAESAEQAQSAFLDDAISASGLFSDDQVMQMRLIACEVPGAGPAQPFVIRHG